MTGAHSRVCTYPIETSSFSRADMIARRLTHIPVLGPVTRRWWTCPQEPLSLYQINRHKLGRTQLYITMEKCTRSVEVRLITFGLPMLTCTTLMTERGRQLHLRAIQLQSENFSARCMVQKLSARVVIDFRFLAQHTSWTSTRAILLGVLFRLYQVEGCSTASSRRVGSSTRSPDTADIFVTRQRLKFLT